MEKGDARIGQQAKQAATKAMRALETGRATFANLEELSREFRAAKRAEERRNAEAKHRELPVVGLHLTMAGPLRGYRRSGNWFPWAASSETA